MGVYGFIDIVSLVTHQLVPGYTIHAGIIQEYIEGVAAIMGRVFCLDATGTYSSTEALAIQIIGNRLQAIVIYKTLESGLISGTYHVIYTGMDGYCAVTAVPVL